MMTDPITVTDAQSAARKDRRDRECMEAAFDKALADRDRFQMEHPFEDVDAGVSIVISAAVESILGRPIETLDDARLYAKAKLAGDDDKLDEDERRFFEALAVMLERLPDEKIAGNDHWEFVRVSAHELRVGLLTPHALRPTSARPKR